MGKRLKKFITNGAIIGFLIPAIGWWLSDTGISTGDDRVNCYVLILLGTFFGGLAGLGIYKGNDLKEDD